MEIRKLLWVGNSDQTSLWQTLCAGGWDVHRASDFATARKKLLEHRFLTGFFFFTRFDDAFCSEVEDLIEMQGGTEWIGVFPEGSMSSAPCRELALSHLLDFHTLPVDPARLLNTIGHAYGQAQLRQSHPSSVEVNSGAIVGRSEGMLRLAQQIARVASTDEAVLIRGESGSGKELAARAVLQYSARAGKPFVAVHCGSLSPTLIQAELFGYEKGAFTGAHKVVRGLIESADGGTIFLDEIGDLSIDLQSNLLRFLQEKTITRLGSTKSIHVDTRVIAATHVNLEERIEKGLFRQDLFYRLSVVPLWIPPLRNRKADLDLLASHFFTELEPYKRRKLRGFSRKAIQAMHDYDWPGNVRELINRIRAAMVMAEGRLITAGDLGLDRNVAAEPSMSLDKARLIAEHRAIRLELDRARNNITQAAHALGVSRMTLYRLMEKHGIHSEPPLSVKLLAV